MSIRHDLDITTQHGRVFTLEATKDEVCAVEVERSGLNIAPLRVGGETSLNFTFIVGHRRYTVLVASEEL